MIILLYKQSLKNTTTSSRREKHSCSEDHNSEESLEEHLEEHLELPCAC